MQSEVDEDRSTRQLAALAELYCKLCEVELSREGQMFSDVVKSLLYNTHDEIEKSVKLTNALRCMPMFDNESCQESIGYMKEGVSLRAEYEDRYQSSVIISLRATNIHQQLLNVLVSRGKEAIGVCKGWVTGADAKLRMSTCETLIESLSDSDCSTLPFAPLSPLHSAEQCPRQSAILRLKKVLRIQYGLEKQRFEEVYMQCSLCLTSHFTFYFLQLNRDHGVYENVPDSLIRRHQQLGERRQLLTSELMSHAT